MIGLCGLYKLPILKVLRLEQPQQCVSEQKRIIAVIESEAHFVEVGLQMLCANTMPRSNDAALEQREGGFHGIRVHVANGVDAVLVTDSLVLREHPGFSKSLWVSRKFVRHDYINVLRDILADVLRQRSGLHILSMEEPEITTTLPDADDNLFLALRMTDLVLVVAALSCADEGFIHFDYAAGRLGICGLHCVPNPMAEIPCGAIVNPQHSLELIGGHPLARLANQERSEEPFNQRQMRVVKHRVSGHGELVAA